MNVKQIPTTVKQGDEIEIQLAPFGYYKGTLYFTDPEGDHKKRPVMQRMDKAAFEKIVNSFVPEVLVDKEHDSENGKSSEAYGWIKALRIDPVDGLMGTCNFTSLGADSISGRVYRFVSAAFEVEEIDQDNIRPIALTSVALTNRNNLPVRCVLNRVDYLAQTKPTVEDKGIHKMIEIAKALGLDENADEAAVLAAIQALVKKAADAEAEVLNAEADKFVDENKDKVCNAADLKAAFLAAPEMAKKFVANVKVQAPAQTKRVTNSAEAAKAPQIDTAKGDVLAVYNSLEGDAKAAYLSTHSQAICEARAAQA